MVASQKPTNPFPGLRPFTAEESSLFFGRDIQILELQQRLKRSRFVAVVGSSGSGKSSLVRAGLLPTCQNNFIAGGNHRWRVAILRPGEDPIGNLARSLNKQGALGIHQNEQWGATFIETTLRLGDLGLAELAQLRLAVGENLLIVIDQFEELFRFKTNELIEDSTDEAAAFVKLCLAATQQQNTATYVLLTMRSDYIGECSQFRDLPEMINRSLYLLPRMTRSQLCEAIRQPVQRRGVAITTRLLNRLLNDVGDDPDQLPVLQHALRRTWDNWAQDSSDNSIDFKHYISIGGMRQALSQHANEVYDQLSARQQEITEILFKCLTEKKDGRYIRRPTELKKICAIVQASVKNTTEQEIIQVVNTFRSEGQSFLTPYTEELSPQSILDISHESLMRIWDKLQGNEGSQGWIDQEADKAEIYRDLVKACEQNQKNQQRALAAKQKHEDDLLSGYRLSDALEWLKSKPNKAWAETYYDKHRDSADKVKFETILTFIRKSERKEKIDRQKWKIATALLAVISMVAIAACFYAWIQSQKAKEGQLSALSSTSEALFSSHQQLKALIESVRAGQQLKQLWRTDPKIRERVLANLRHMIYEVRERNILEASPSNEIFCVAFSPDGQILATSGADQTITVWKRNGEMIQRLHSHQNSVRSINFSPDGQMLVSGDENNEIKLWVRDGNQGNWMLNRRQSEFLEKHKHDGAVLSLEFSPDGQMLASGSTDGQIKIWSLFQGKTITLKHSEREVNSVKFSPDGKTIASASDDTTIKLWTLDGKNYATFAGHNQPVEDISFSPDGKIIASASDDKTIKLWNVATKKPEPVTLGEEEERHLARVSSVNFSPDGQVLVSASHDHTVKLWKIPEATLITTLPGHTKKVNAVRFSRPDGLMIASASSDRTVRLWSQDNRDSATVIATDHSDNINQVHLAPNGKLIATASFDKTVKLWQLNGELHKTLRHDEAVMGVNFSPDGQIIASASKDKTIRLWSLDGKLLKILKGHNGWVRRVNFSPNNQIIASASLDGTIKLWQLDGNLMKTLKQHGGGVLDVSFSPNGRMLASGSVGRNLMLWKSNGDLQALLKGHTEAIYSVAFSPNSQLLASSDADGIVKLWHIPTMKPVNTLKGTGGIIWDVSFSPDEQLIVSANEDGTLQLWNRQRLLNTLKGHDGSIYSVSFNHDGRILASVGEDRKIILWQLSLNDLLASGCHKVRDYLKTNPSVITEDRHLCDSF